MSCSECSHYSLLQARCMMYSTSEYAGCRTFELARLLTGQPIPQKESSGDNEESTIPVMPPGSGAGRTAPLEVDPSEVFDTQRGGIVIRPEPAAGNELTSADRLSTALAHSEYSVM